MQPNQPLTLADHRLLDLVWPNQPLPSGRLCQIAQEQLGWKRTTTYTVLKRLCDKGYLKNEASVVTALVDRATVQRADGQEVLQRSFQGSLPSFLAAFLQAGTVSDQEAEEIAQMLDDYRHSHDRPRFLYLPLCEGFPWKPFSRLY